MRVFRVFPRFVWVLLGLLAISAGILSIGQRDTDANPSVQSYGPSGTSAFAVLLQKAGYSVRVDTRSHPAIAADEIAIAFELQGVPSYLASSENSSRQAFHEEIRSGRRAIIATVPYDFLSSSKRLLASQPTTVSTDSGRLQIYTETTPNQLQVYPALEETAPPAAFDENDAKIAFWKGGIDGSPVIQAYQRDKGQVLEVSNAAFLTNRFLDRAQDAEAALRLVEMIAPKGSKIVFCEALIGNIEDPGLLECIGAWALGGWRQLIFLGVVIVYTLGKRFGLPDETRPVQRGARELLDGLADTYFRGRHVKAAMGATLDRANHELRAALRLPRDASRADRDERLPAELRQALTNLQNAYESDAQFSGDQVLKLVAAVRSQTNEFLRGARLRIETA